MSETKSLPPKKEGWGAEEQTELGLEQGSLLVPLENSKYTVENVVCRSK